ncbi:MAG: tetratricopeptide repeat protein [Verrucomicrobia bacterium]|nr:tetratricopeptide repeat protein [Verrucomicrobiota bacterium]
MKRAGEKHLTNPEPAPHLVWLAPVLLALVTLLVFWRATTNEFVNYDDPDYVTKNTWVQKGLTIDSVKWAFTTGHASNWHPLTWLSHMLDWQLFGENPKGHHLTNLLFHAFNVVLLFFVLRKMTGFFWRAAFIAALFALHPLRVESVAWISERKDVLSTFFGFISIWFYASYVQARGAMRSVRENVTAYILALFFFALSLMSKPMLVTLPFLLFLLDMWPLKRFSVFSFQYSVGGASRSQSEHRTLKTEHWPRLLLEKVPYFALIVASSVITFLVQKKGGAVSGALDLDARVANALISYCRYLHKLFWPEKLSVLYPHPGSWPTGMVIAAALLLAAISALAIRQLRRRPWFFVGWFWFIGTAVPVIGIVQVGIQSMADRYTYIPMIGVYIVLTWTVCEFTAKFDARKQILIAGSAVVLVACSLLTVRQIGVWQNSMTLFEHAVAVTDKNYLAYNNLGFFISEKSRSLSGEARLRKVDEAIDKYRRSIEIKPNYEEALNNLGHALAEKGLHAEAVPYYRHALKIKPDLIQAHNNLGNALSEIGQIDEAIQHFHFVLKREPENVDAHNNLGVALAMKGQIEKAMEHLQKAVELNPKNVSARSNLGNAFAMQRKLDRAAEQYRAVLKENTRDARTHNNLANVLGELGQPDEAITHYRKALELEPINPEANFNLALTLIRQGKRDEAVPHLKEALRLRPNYPEAQRQLNLLLGQN